MKEERMLRAFSLVDDELVESAAPKAKKPKTPRYFKRLAYIAVAACLLCMIVLPIAFLGGGGESVPVATTPADTAPNACVTTPADTIPKGGVTTEAKQPNNTQPVTTQITNETPLPLETVPPPVDVVDPLDQYIGSEYYPLIVKLDAFFQNASSGDDDIVSESASSKASGEKTGESKEDGKEPEGIVGNNGYVFLVREQTLEVYSASQGNLRLVCEYELASGSYHDSCLLENGNRLLLFGKERYEFMRGAFTERSVLLLLDVSDPLHVKELHNLKASGLVDSFYEKEDCLILVNKYTIPLTPQYHEPSSFVPEVEHDQGERTLLMMKDFVMTPREITSRYYTVVYALNPETLAVMSCKVVLGASKAVNLSEEHIYVSTSRRESLGYISKNVSDIECFTYGHGILALKGEITLDGTVEDSTYLDEKNGVLRVVTEMGYYKKNVSSVSSQRSYVGASFYVVSLKSMQLVTKLEEFSPNGNDLHAVCFDGNKVYVSTGLGGVGEAPLILLDFSDYANITTTVLDDVGSYITTLVPFENGNLLGIGQTSVNYEKMVQICRSETERLTVIDRYTVANATLAADSKAYYIDPARQLVGFASTVKDDANNEKTYYILLYFDGETLVEILREECEGELFSFRASVRDGWLYLVSDKDVKALQVNRD